MIGTFDHSTADCPSLRCEPQSGLLERHKQGLCLFTGRLWSASGFSHNQTYS
jgi:hypothetical protein